MLFNKQLHIIIIIEKGVLEKQALLLIESINKFVAPFINVNTLVFSPRNKTHHPSDITIKNLKRLGANYIDLPLNNKYDFFPLCNGIYGASYAENNASEDDLLLLVDTDTVFSNTIETDVLNFRGLSIRPVDNKGIGSSGSNDVNNVFWNNAFSFFGIQPQRKQITTTIDQQKIRPYYNSGFVLCPQNFGFFNEWKFCFEQIMESDIRTNASFSRYQSDYGFLEQMTLSVVSEKIDIPTQLLPTYYNYPIPFRHKFIDTLNHIPLSKLRHIHYHRWFQHPSFLYHVTTDADRQTEFFLWVKQHLPFHPLIDDPFK